jgi:GTP-binding protein
MLIISSNFETSAPTIATAPPAYMPEFAFIGRSNVGKSSLLNLISGRRELARVSKIPGFTKMINFFIMNKQWRLVDLPGYGYAKIARENSARFNAAVTEYLTQRPTLLVTFVLIDSRHAPQKIDLEFVQWLGGQSIPFVLVFTKIDQSKPEEVQENIRLFQEKMSEWWDNLPQVFTCSSVKRIGQAELLAFIEQTLQEEPDDVVD